MKPFRFLAGATEPVPAREFAERIRRSEAAGFDTVEMHWVASRGAAATSQARSEISTRGALPGFRSSVPFFPATGFAVRWLGLRDFVEAVPTYFSHNFKSGKKLIIDSALIPLKRTDNSIDNSVFP